MERSLITINTSHYIGQNKYKIIIPPTMFSNSTLSIESFAMYNSLFNITAQYANNQFSIIWIDGNTYSFIIPDSYMEYADINSYIEQQCLLNNLYMTSNNGTDNIFFFNISSNLSRYKVQLDVYYIPTVSQASTLGWSLPPNCTWALPSSNTTPQIYFNKGMCTLFGFKSVQNYPPTPQSTNYTFLSDGIPKLLQVFTILLTCSLVDNKVSQLRTLFSQIPVQSAFGSLISVNKSTYTRVPILPRQYTDIEITLLDQDYNPITINDTDFSLILMIETKI